MWAMAWARKTIQTCTVYLAATNEEGKEKSWIKQKAASARKQAKSYNQQQRVITAGHHLTTHAMQSNGHIVPLRIAGYSSTHGRRVQAYPAQFSTIHTLASLPTSMYMIYSVSLI
jgi:hypothetical protein